MWYVPPCRSTLEVSLLLMYVWSDQWMLQVLPLYQQIMIIVYRSWLPENEVNVRNFNNLIFLWNDWDNWFEFRWCNWIFWEWHDNEIYRMFNLFANLVRVFNICLTLYFLNLLQLLSGTTLINIVCTYKISIAMNLRLDVILDVFCLRLWVNHNFSFNALLFL